MTTSLLGSVAQAPKRARQLAGKVRGRLARLLRQYVPQRLRYRPVGVHASSKQLAHERADVHYFLVVPAYLSEVSIPPDFYDQASVYGGLHGKPNFQELMPEAFVVELSDGRVYADNLDSVAVISADNRLMGDVSFQYTSRHWTTLPPRENNIFYQRWFEEPLRIDGTVCTLLSGGGAGTGNYYHWLVDSLPRLYLVQQAGLLHQIDYFLVYDKQLSFVRETMAGLGIGPERLLDVKEHRHIQARRLVATTPVRGLGTHTPAWACEFLRRNYPPDPALLGRFSPLVYVSRRDAPGRHVTNEADVEALLAQHGFQSYALSELSFAEKRALFAGARVVISPVGAGLCNTAFCRTGTQLLELLPEDFVVADYLEFSARLSIQHRYLVCPATPRVNDRRQAQAQHLTVPLPAFTALLEEMLRTAAVAAEPGPREVPAAPVTSAPAR
ncbi:glycosyltransferase family 61 protein [Hymenobacter sp. CRA2]|uniref:glycosyltransferase family 61 protein n=1 Tax=Hymenobacter sp. CRA2 TaxID=1955620 RepID=UPI00098F1770|nr:glycosyltransferase family 61 protein [Hymenobacter sp. CRA2]OON66057.1 hypothetical protein B0919_22765 [Hymenobacter sp. CRA2]